MRRLLFLTLIFIMYASLGFCCRCAGPYEPDFYENIHWNSKMCLAIYQGEITNPSTNRRMGQFDLLYKISEFGPAVGEAIYTFPGDGDNCALELDALDVGDSLFLILYGPIGDTSNAFDEYELFEECGRNYLKVENGLCNGRTVQEVIDELYAWSGNDDVIRATNDLHLYPNPAEEWLFVRSTVSNIKSIRVYDLQGNMILERSPEQSDVMQINLKTLNRGVHLVAVFIDDDWIWRLITKE